MYKFLIKLITPFVKFFLRVKIEGEVNIPEGERFIICANHLSNWDPVLVLVCTGIPINFLAKDSLFKVPVLKSILKAVGTIPVKRNGSDTAPIRKSIEVIKEGGSFSIFP
jgi:1-acyl-sn-glycerol-3-phosphate acyltransferase